MCRPPRASCWRSSPPPNPLHSSHSILVWDVPSSRLQVVLTPPLPPAPSCSILVWDAPSSQLQVVRQYGTQEACTSCLFTPTSLVVAADKLYEIDLSNFTIEEFLDESDTSLAYAVYGTQRMSSFPLAVLQVGYTAPSAYLPSSSLYFR